MIGKEGEPSKNGFGKFLYSFVYAIRGVKLLFRTERNAWIHLAIMSCAVALGFIFSISSTEWIMIILCSGLVLGTEAMNTAIEYLANYCTPEKDEQIRKVKDVAAGAVLICAFASLIVGLIIFTPKIFSCIT